jgi:hypothetical protein
LFGTQEQVDAESDLVERAVISVDVAVNKESDMPQAAGPLGGGDQVQLVFRRGARVEVAGRDLRRVLDAGNQGRDRNIDEGQVGVGKVEVPQAAAEARGQAVTPRFTLAKLRVEKSSRK